MDTAEEFHYMTCKNDLGLLQAYILHHNVILREGRRTLKLTVPSGALGSGEAIPENRKWCEKKKDNKVSI